MRKLLGKLAFKVAYAKSRAITWWSRIRLDRAQAVIERCGLTVVKLHRIAGTTYVVKADGSYWKLIENKKGK
jgi:hypothetical protein